MHDEFLTTRELADLLRIKERKVYELAGQGDVPCTKVTGKLLFPTDAVRDWLAKGRLDTTAPRPPSICLGSHDPLFEWALAHADCALPSYFDGSLDGLDRFCAGEGICCALHLYAADDQLWNLSVVSDRCRQLDAVLLNFATRRRGLLIGSGSSIAGLSDLAGKRVAARQARSGAQILFDQLLANTAIDAESISRTEMARDESGAALAVAEDRADAAFGLEVYAARYHLDFVPIIDERYDLLVHRAAWFDPALQCLQAFCRRDAFVEHARSFAGYDLSDCWRVVWNA